MEDPVVGEGDLSIHEVSKVIEKSTSCAVLQANWRLFAYYLGVNDVDLPGLERRINQGTLQLKETPRELLHIWKAKKGSGATLKSVCEALDDCDLKDIADALKAKFCQSQPEAIRKFILNEKLQSLEELFQNNVPDGIIKLFQMHCRDYPAAVPIKIIKKEMCPFDLPEFYIPRTLLHRNQLNEKVFEDSSTKDHVFLVQGATKTELARACGSKQIEESGNQLSEVTVHHILFECDEDFHTISMKTTNPIHLIQHENNSFTHIKSTKGIDVIQAFVKDSGTLLDDEVVVKKTTGNNSPCFLSIADSPGMGKTYLLAKMFTQIKENHSNAINLFIVLQELANNLSYSDLNSAEEIISNYATPNYLAQCIFQGLLRTNIYRLFIFLDGYDEILRDKLDLVDSFLLQLVRYPHIKAFITTRAHLKPRLEGISQKLSLEILPFSESNQIDFLSKYWSSKHGAINGETLRSFAKKCLQALKVNMTPTETDIAGIPLQCSMLAQVYAKQAKRAAKFNTLPDDVVMTTSFFEMYKLLMEQKFKRIGSSLELSKKYIDAHIHDSIALLFPHWLKRLKSFLSPRQGVEESIMYSIGLIEKSLSSNSPRFQHRTFAECLLAQFIVWNLDKDAVFIEFLYTEIFSAKGTIRRKKYFKYLSRPTIYELKHPVIAYFIDMYLQDSVKSNDRIVKPVLCNPLLSFVAPAVNNFIQRRILGEHVLTKIHNEDLCIAANACCTHGLENCFDLTKVILKKTYINHNVALKKRYFKDLPHLVVERTKNASLLKKVLVFTKMELGVDFHWHVLKGDYQFSWNLSIPDCTPLHVAVYHGRYNMVIYLLEEYGQHVLSIKYLMHCLLDKSFKNSESIIDNKESIIQSLNRVNFTWMEDDFIRIREKPIQLQNAHIKLTKYVAYLGNTLQKRGDKKHADLLLGELTRKSLKVFLEFMD